MTNMVVRIGRFFKIKLAVMAAPLPRLSRLDRIAAKLLMCLLGHCLRAENVERLAVVREPAVFVFNHNTYIETVCAYLFLLFRFRGEKPCFLIDWMFAHVPVIGWFIRRSDPVYIYNKRARFSFIECKRQARLDTIEQCLNALARGRSIGIFPEGKANRDARILLKGREGAGHLVLSSGAEVVPVGIVYETSGASGEFPAPGCIIFRFGAIMAFSAAPVRRRQAGARTVAGLRLKRRRAAAVIDLIMRNLALLSGKAYPYREMTPVQKLTMQYYV
jgi:1-acyl-sn-glycerol-3-phosphate acyltransferase